MTKTLIPRDEAELEALVAEAAARAEPLAVAGGATRSGLGRPMTTAATVSTAELTGVTLYEPAELVVSAKAGTPVAEVSALLAESNQRLSFEPMDHRGLYGTAGEPTMGGIAAANVSGPRRIEVGAARDSLIGVRAVTGRGETVKSGGRVMKNVTGYDLVKFLAGSYGTLAILTEVTLKVAPLAETERTLVLSGLDATSAVAALSAGLGSPYAVSGAAYVPGEAGGQSVTAMRLEGFQASVARRIDKLAKLNGEAVKTDTLDAEASGHFWAGVRDLTALNGHADLPVWRISVPPSRAPAVMERAASLAPGTMVLDWGGGLMWVPIGADAGDAGASVMRAAAAEAGGHATLARASDAVRTNVEVFQPLPAATMAITRSLKHSFDPAGILNPGRMYAGL